MPQAERHAQRAAGVAGRRLHPHLLERPLAQDAAVADAVERDAAGQAQVAHPGLAVRERGHLQHHLFGDVLNRARQVHLALRQLALGLARRPADQPLERAAGHRQPVRVREVLHVHPQAAIVADLEEVVLDELDVLRLAVRREAHHLVLARVHPEAGEVGEGRVQQAERVRKAQFPQQLDVAAAPDADRRGRPLADAVHRDDGRLLEGRRIEGRGRRATRGARRTASRPRSPSSSLADVVGHPQLVAQPQRQRHQVRPEPRGAHAM